MRSPPVLVVKPPPCRQQQEAVCHAESPRSMQVAWCNLCTALNFLVQRRKGDLVSAGATCWLPAREGILFLGVRRPGMKQNVQLYCVNEFCIPFRDFFFFLWVTVSIQKVLVLFLFWLEGPVVPGEHVAMLAYCEHILALGGKWQPPSPKPFPCAGGGRASAPARAKAMPGCPAAGGEGNTKQQGYGSSGYCSILLE